MLLSAGSGISHLKPVPQSGLHELRNRLTIQAVPKPTYEHLSAAPVEQHPAVSVQCQPYLTHLQGRLPRYAAAAKSPSSTQCVSGEQSDSESANVKKGSLLNMPARDNPLLDLTRRTKKISHLNANCS